MKKLFLLICICTMVSTVQAQNIDKCSIEEVIRRTSGNDTLYIVNFWATWCAPCVAELPEFNALQKDFAGMPVKILLVSLDFKEDYFKLPRFIELKKLKPQVVWLTDTDPNEFIPKVDGSWQGSIPATMMVHPGKSFRHFIEGSITEKQIVNLADRVLR